jgi:CBS domain-containing protein
MNGTGSETLTAGDLMSRELETVPADLPLRDAAARLARRGVHGVPVVDADGRCVGVLSATDVARWAGGGAPPPRPLTCGYLETHHEPGGRETVACKLAAGVCPFQRPREAAAGGPAVACSDPHCVPVDWQVVELETRPGDRVRDVMSAVVVTAAADAPVTGLAHLMLDSEVRRLVVVDAAGRPVGVVAAADLLQVRAHPEFGPPGGG